MSEVHPNPSEQNPLLQTSRLMLLTPLRVARPELRNEVVGLVERLHGSADGVTFPLVELVRLLGITVAPAFHAELEARGQIHFDHQHFRNDGSAIRRRVRLGGVEMQLEVSSNLRGDVERCADGSMRLVFERSATVRLSKLVLRARLHVLHMHTDHIDVELRGGGGLRIDLV